MHNIPHEWHEYIGYHDEKYWAAHVNIGQSVNVKLDAFPNETFPGKVTAIDPVGREKSGDMTYKVTITLDKAEPRFKWNMTANVDINVE